MRSRKCLALALTLLLFPILGPTTSPAWATDIVTREYILKNIDSSLMIRALNIAVSNSSGKRILGGQGKRLVVTDTEEAQLQVLELLPVFDVPTTETNPDKALMNMMMVGARYLHKKKLTAVAQKSNPDESRAAATVAGGPDIHSYDTYTSTRSIYAEEDARLMRKRRVLEEQGALPSLSELTLKGIFRSATGAPLGLLVFGNINYVARNGGLYERNRLQLKDVKSEVLSDRVILTGLDRRPREFKFKSTL